MDNPRKQLTFGIEALLNLSLILTPLIWIPFTSELFEFPKMLLIYSIAILVLTLWLVKTCLTNTFTWTKHRLNLVITIFLVTQIIATIFSIHPHTSIYGYYSRFHGGLLSTISYLILFAATAAHIPQNRLKYLLISLFTGAMLASLYAFPEHFGHSPSCQFITSSFDANCWVQDVQLRVFGTFGQPNWLAAYLISIIFIPASLLLTNLRFSKPAITLKNVSYIALTALFFSVLIFTKSRSGLLGFAVGSLVFTITQLIPKSHRTKTTIASIGSFLILCLLLFFLFGKGTTPQTDQLFTLFSQPPSPTSSPTIETPMPQIGTQLDTGGTESGEIRKIVWQGAWDLFTHHPLIGTGVETFAYAYYNTRPASHNLVSEWDFLYNKAHNEFLNILATTGILGFSAYLLLIISISLYALNNIIHGHNPSLNSALLSGLWALMVSNFFGFSTVPVGLLMWMYAALIVITSGIKPTNFSIPWLRNQSTSIITAVICAILGLFLLGKVLLMLSADISYNRAKTASQTDLLTAMTELQNAMSRFKSEPTYTDQLSVVAAQAAAAISASGNTTAAAQLASQAAYISDVALAQNPVHLNFYKSRARVFIQLTPVSQAYIYYALNALTEALKLAPTDAKITYNIALLYDQLDDFDQASRYYQQTIQLKPNYYEAIERYQAMRDRQVSTD